MTDPQWELASGRERDAMIIDECARRVAYHAQAASTGAEIHRRTHARASVIWTRALLALVEALSVELEL